MTLLPSFLSLVDQWRFAFPRQASWRLAAHHSLGAMLCLGRRCLTRIIWIYGEEKAFPGKHSKHTRAAGCYLMSGAAEE